MIEYASTTCPHCAEFHETVWDQFKENYIDTGKVRFIFREYPTSLLGLATGQVLNIAMSILGLVLIGFVSRRRRGGDGTAVTVAPDAPPVRDGSGIAWRRVLLAVLVLFPLVIPSDWTQDVPERYGKRHAGLVHSAVYPRIEAPAGAGPPTVHPSDPPGRAVKPERCVTHGWKEPLGGHDMVTGGVLLLVTRLAARAWGERTEFLRFRDMQRLDIAI